MHPAFIRRRAAVALRQSLSHRTAFTAATRLKAQGLTFDEAMQEQDGCRALFLRDRNWIIWRDGRWVNITGADLAAGHRSRVTPSSARGRRGPASGDAR